MRAVCIDFAVASHKMPVKLYLSSDNPATHHVCREALTGLVGHQWTLHCGNAATSAPDADLYIWDIESNTGIFTDIQYDDKWRHFFFVDRADLQPFRDSLRFQDANILLKPVTKTALLAFVMTACEQVVTARRSVNSLRADRDAILQCFMQANLKLQEYDHDRTNFLARAIHDFRAPLTAVTGYCGLLLGEDLGALTDEQREVIDRMHRSAKKLSRMASAMFQLSTAPRAENTTLEMQAGDINDCVEQALHEILPTAQEKRLCINVDIAPSPEALFFDRMKIEQVLVNLLDNACKFAPRVGTIEIRGYPFASDYGFTAGDFAMNGMGRTRVNDRPNFYRLDIRDTGPGIPATHLTKIFEEYTSYGGGADRSGGGLGLAICRLILDQHKGRIWAETAKHGAVFSFVLPFHHGAMTNQEPLSRAMNARAF
jgi:signal transduction histidine kinase